MAICALYEGDQALAAMEVDCSLVADSGGKLGSGIGARVIDLGDIRRRSVW